MALNLTAIREALAEQISQGTGRGVRGYPYPTGAIHELPCVVVRRGGDDGVDYHVDMGTQCDANLTLDVMAPCRTSLEDGLRVLDELLSAAAGLPNSVIDAVEADTTLGGVVDMVVLGIASDEIGFGSVDEGRPLGVMSSVPVQVWVNRS